jgi:hypothetical protein
MFLALPFYDLIRLSYVVKKLFTITSVEDILSGMEYPTLETINVRPTY